MKKLIAIAFIVGVVVVQIVSCSKEDGPDNGPVLPLSDTTAIEFISITPNPAIKYQDEIRITIKYTDGDGDLGANLPDVKNAYITDSRNNVTYQFRIPQQAPDSAEIAITGQLTFVLTPQGFVDDNNTSETATYSVYVVDRAGHQSNTVQSGTLVINK